jgi:hypothetical protein
MLHNMAFSTVSLNTNSTCSIFCGFVVGLVESCGFVMDLLWTCCGLVNVQLVDLLCNVVVDYVKVHTLTCIKTDLDLLPYKMANIYSVLSKLLPAITHTPQRYRRTTVQSS